MQGKQAGRDGVGGFWGSVEVVPPSRELLPACTPARRQQAPPRDSLPSLPHPTLSLEGLLPPFGLTCLFLVRGCKSQGTAYGRSGSTYSVQNCSLGCRSVEALILAGFPLFRD